MEENNSIPVGWDNLELSKLTNFATGKKDVNQGSSIGEYPFFTCSKKVFSSEYYSFDKEALLIAGNGDVGTVHYYKGKFEAYQRTYILSNFSVDVQYLYHYLKSNLIKHLSEGQSGTTIQFIKISQLKNFKILTPVTLKEQSKIAEILSKVDNAISETEIIIAKYNHIKTGLMQDLLTKGIDEKGNIRSEETHKFKDSPLGRIPKEWKVDVLKNLCNSDITYGIVQAGPNIENGIPYIRTGDMSGDCLSIDNLLKTTQKIAERFERSKVLKGEIVFALRATIGKVLLVPVELNGANLTQGTARISANENKVKNEFILYCLRMQYFKTQILENQKGTTFFEISLGHLRNFKVFYPKSIDEQNKIIEGLNDIEESKIKFKEELSKLKSIKTGLMQDLLSGKKRVTHLIN